MTLATDREPKIYDDMAHQRAFATMHAVADGLADQGLDVLGQEWDEAHYLKATNAWGALCEATVGADGVFTWEYRPVDAIWEGPEDIVRMALTLLGADAAAGERGQQLARYPGQTLRGAVGLTARARGMQAELTQVFGHPDFLEVNADLKIINPARPERGSVFFNGSAVRWECRLAGSGTETPGLEVAEITKTIGSSVPQLQVINAPHSGPDAAQP